MVLQEYLWKKILYRCLTVLRRSDVRARRPLSQPMSCRNEKGDPKFDRDEIGRVSQPMSCRNEKGDSR